MGESGDVNRVRDMTTVGRERERENWRNEGKERRDGARWRVAEMQREL